MESEKSFSLGLAMLSSLHITEAHFNLVSSWFTLRDCLYLPPRHASLLLIISYKRCIICVSSKRRPLQPSQGNILFWSLTRFTNTVPVQCLMAPALGNSLNREIMIPAIWVSPDLTPAEWIDSVGYSYVPQSVACLDDLQRAPRNCGIDKRDCISVCVLTVFTVYKVVCVSACAWSKEKIRQTKRKSMFFFWIYD